MKSTFSTFFLIKLKILKYFNTHFRIYFSFFTILKPNASINFIENLNRIYILAVGTHAPDFELYSTPDQKVKLNELKGHKVIIAFYPADWSPVCSDELTIFNEALRFFSRHNAQLIAISVDSKWSHLAFSRSHNFHFPLLADFEPKGAVAKLYKAYDETEGQCNRVLYVIDEHGVIRWAYQSPVGINPGADGILDALETLDNT